MVAPPFAIANVSLSATARMIGEYYETHPWYLALNVGGAVVTTGFGLLIAGPAGAIGGFALSVLCVVVFPSFREKVRVEKETSSRP